MDPFDFNDAAMLMSNPLLFAGMGRAPQANNIGNYVQNYEKHRLVRQSMYPPRTMGRGAGAPYGAQAPMPNFGAGYGLDENSMGAMNDALQNVDPRLSVPSHINPFLMFNDQNAEGQPTWAGNHPRFAHSLEGALIGATTPGGNTMGENISNVARTVLGIPGMYRENAQAQMQAPINVANSILGLQRSQAQIAQEEAATKLSGVHADYYRHLADQEKFQKPIVNPVTGEVITEDPDNPGHWQKDPTLQEKAKPQPFGFQSILDQYDKENPGKRDFKTTMSLWKDFNINKEAGKPSNRVPHLDPRLDRAIKESENEIKDAQAELNHVEPKDEFQRTMLYQMAQPDKNGHVDETAKKVWDDYQGAKDRLQKARDRHSDLLQRHLNFSRDADATESSDTSGNSDIPQPIASVRTAGPLAPQDKVLDNNGNPAQVVQGPLDSKGRPTLQVQPAPQPGTKKSQPQKTAPAGKADPNNPLGLNF